MPERVRRERGGGYAIQHEKGGKWSTVGHSTSREKAESSVRARRAGRHGWKPTRKRRK